MDIQLDTLPFGQTVITFAERIVIVRQALRVADQIMSQFDQYPTWEEYCRRKGMSLEEEER